MKKLGSILILFVALGLMAMNPVKDTGKQPWAVTSAYESCITELEFEDDGSSRVRMFCCEFTTQGTRCWYEVF